MKKIFICTMLAFSTLQCLANPSDKTCSVIECSAGDKAVTYASKSEPYYACPTRELADYTSFIAALIEGSMFFLGKIPNISDKTGEPEYLDNESGPNETRLMLDELRNKAKVTTFDEAIAICSEGINKRKIIIMNSREDEPSIWVMDEKTKKTFWMPKSNLDKL